MTGIHALWGSEARYLTTGGEQAVGVSKHPGDFLFEQGSDSKKSNADSSNLLLSLLLLLLLSASF